MTNEAARQIARQIEDHLKRFVRDEDYHAARESLLKVVVSYGDAVAEVTTKGAIQGMQNVFDRERAKWN